jgi:hypothetical protein
MQLLEEERETRLSGYVLEFSKNFLSMRVKSVSGYRFNGKQARREFLMRRG